MTLQASGAIAISDINVELGLASNAQNDLNNADVRDLADVPSGMISLMSFYGKSSFSAQWSGGVSMIKNAQNQDYIGLECSGNLLRQFWFGDGWSSWMTTNMDGTFTFPTQFIYGWAAYCPGNSAGLFSGTNTQTSVSFEMSVDINGTKRLPAAAYIVGSGWSPQGENTSSVGIGSVLGFSASGKYIRVMANSFGVITYGNWLLLQ